MKTHLSYLKYIILNREKVLDSLTLITIAVVISSVVLLYVMTKARPDNRKVFLKLVAELQDLRSDLKTGYKDPSVIVINADTVLTKALQTKHGKKDPAGELLKQSKVFYQRKVYNKLWDAHKIRNKIAHESYAPDKEEALKALMAFERGIKMLI